MGGLVTKQAISKYETGKDHPSPVVMNRMAAALHVKSRELWAEPQVEVAFVAYRRQARLPKAEQRRIESIVTEALEHRVRLQDLTGQKKTELLVDAFPVNALADAEAAAVSLRKHWRLGLDPIASVIGILEDHYVHVVEVDAKDGFDGISAIARNGGENKAAAVVTKRGVDGERQRLNITHELGHLVCKMGPNVDEEKAAFQFGAAFLAPAEVIYREVGAKRHLLQVAELLLLKKRFGLSMQALLHRLRDLDVITQSYYASWWPLITKLGWRRREPEALKPERPQWLAQTLLRAVSEELLSIDEAERILPQVLESTPPLPLVGRRAFLKLPLDQRRRLMEEQAAKAEAYYRSDLDLGSLGADLADA